MKLELERIPVWDGVRSASECYVCDLMGEAQSDAINFYLGSSVMNPETRVRVNESGFCPSHWQMLLAANKPQGLSLMADTYLGTTRERLRDSLADLSRAKGRRSARAAVARLAEQIFRREAGCLVCTAMEGRLMRYLFTTAYLWEQEEEFRNALLASKGFCLHHFALLLERGQEAVSKGRYDAFVAEMTRLETENLDRIARDLHWMTQMYKSENRDKEWNGSEDAHRRGVDKMTGLHRVIDPV
ncbi:MAG: DUF6062 family protein [Sphaerochaeta sp.]|jgi:hypothetical protein|nr:DUF6062 family protein [Sphaerochaeta sp.]